MKRLGQGLVWVGSLLLVATAAFHATGYSSVVRQASAAGVPEFLAAAAKGLWLFASYHWLFVAVLAALASRFPSPLSRTVLMLSAGVIAVDGLLLLVHVGPFLGEALLAAVVLAYGAGALLQEKRAR